MRHDPPSRTQRAESSAYDASRTTVATSTIFIAAESRSGSTLISNALWASGIAGFPAEYFQTPVLFDFSKRWRVPKADARGLLGDLRRRVDDRHARREYFSYKPDSVPAFVQKLVEERTSENGVFAVKTLYFDFERFLLNNGLDHRAFPGEVRCIRLRRRDTLRQAISGAKAQSTGQWDSSDTSTQRPVYSREAIEDRLVVLARSRDRWRNYFEQRNIEPLDLWYEDLLDDYDAVITSVFHHAGLTPPDPLPAPPLQRLSDATNDEWRERYLRGD